MARKSYVVMVTGIMIFFLCSISSADVPHMINYQGKLTTAAGGCVNDTVSMTFTIYSDSLGTSVDWTESQTQVVVKEGIFNVLLGSVNHLPGGDTVFDGSTKYLGVQVESDPEMRPLKPMVSVAYAYRAGAIDGGPSSGWIDDGTVVRLETSTDYVGIGTPTPGNKLHVVGSESVPILNVEQYGSFRAVRVYSQNACALWVANAGNHGLRVTNAGGDGIHVEQAGNNGIRVKNAGGFAGYFEGSGYFRDNVGIGTTSPAEKLDVAGNIHTSGTITSGSSITIDGANDKITASGGTIDFDDENLVTTGKATIGPGHNNAGIYAFVAGQNNTTTGWNSTVGGGRDNMAGNAGSTVGGGVDDTASGAYSTVSGGAINVASGQHSTVAGGNVNLASGDYSTVSGGAYDTASGWVSSIGGGTYNVASGDYAAVGGGFHNRARGEYSVVSGGGGGTAADSNAAIGDYSAIGGGRRNKATNIYATVGGGYNNIASGERATVGGGVSNTASGYGATVGGGPNGNVASGYNTTVCGGDYNFATGSEATICAGHNNRARGSLSFVGGGGGGVGADSNAANGNWSVVVGGHANRVNGSYATIPGGESNRADGSYSFAAGRRAKANHAGSFVWADQTNADFASTGNDQFLIRASGGVGIGTTSPQGALDVSSTTGAFIVPRMTTAQRDALSAVNGMIIYNTTDNQFNFYENSAWVTK